MIHLCSCRVQLTKTSPSIYCVAVLANPGVAEVLSFIAPDGVSLHGEVYKYTLTPWLGAISIPSGE